jgi:hypothetical protein
MKKPKIAFKFGSLTQFLVLVVFLVALAPCVLGAVQIGYESAAVGRIVGDSPSEMIKQLQQDNFNLKKATYFTNVRERFFSASSSEEVESVLESSFNNNVDSHIIPKTLDWDWDTVQNAVNNWNKKNLFILEADGEWDDELVVDGPVWFDAKIDAGSSNWFNFDNYDPLFIFNVDYGGLYLPKEDSFVKEYGQDSLIIAPTAISDNEFLKVLVCNLGRYDDISKSYRNARNNYYWQTNAPSGLALMSYSLLGNPTAKIDLPNNNFQNSYCDDVIKDYDLVEMEEPNYKIYKTYEFGTEDVIDDLYTYEAEEIIDTHGVEDLENYSLIVIDGYTQSKDDGFLVLPRTFEKLNLPLGTIVTNITILEKNNPVNINVDDVPEWEGEFINKICEVNSYDASVRYAHSFTEDYEVIILEINPVEVVDCENGQFTLYNNIKYKVDYLPNSAVLFDSILYQDVVVPGSNTGVDVKLKRIKPVEINGKVRIRQGDTIVSEKIINFNQEEYVVTSIFEAPPTEGLFNYIVEFVEEGTVKSSTSFNLKVATLDASLFVPEQVWGTANVGVEMYNHILDQMDVILYYELTKSDALIDSGTINSVLNPGLNMEILTFENLLKEDESYSLTVEVNYNNFKKVLSGLIITNHRPVIESIPDIYVKEGQMVDVEVSAFDSDYDSVVISISEPVGNNGLWVPSYSDSGEHEVTVTASDGFLVSTKMFTVFVEDVPEDNQKVVFRDCNFGYYRGGLAEVSMYDYETELLESWYMSGLYDEVNEHFAFKSFENWPVGTCLNQNLDKICVEDSDVNDPTWGVDDDYPDPVFEKGGTCEIDFSPIYKYKDHETCQGGVNCIYPACLENIECGTPQWIGDKYCDNNAVHLVLREFTCEAAGTLDAYCDNADTPTLLEACNGLQECYQGHCVDIQCNEDSDCGDNYFIGKYCTDEGVFDNFRTYTCANAGTAQSSCEVTDDPKFVEICDLENEICLYGNCVDKDNYLVNQFSDGNPFANYIFYQAGVEIKSITLPKNADVVSTSVKVRGGQQ